MCITFSFSSATPSHLRSCCHCATRTGFKAIDCGQSIEILPRDPQLLCRVHDGIHPRPKRRTLWMRLAVPPQVLPGDANSHVFPIELVERFEMLDQRFAHEVHVGLWYALARLQIVCDLPE